MVMNPRTHPRGARPDFSMAGLPPAPKHTTPALWWLVQMRLRLEPLSENGGTFANKRQYHNTGQNLLDHRDENGNHDWANDPSIRRTPDRTGPWWRDFAAAHDWTFTRAHTGNYTEIKKYTRRLRDSMRSLTDTRPDDVYAYTIGQINDNRTVEGWNEYDDDDESGDSSHLWHRHDSFRRNIIGDFWAMWKALTIDMGWTYAEWLASTEEDDMAGITQEDFNARFEGALKDPDIAAAMRRLPWQYVGGGIPKDMSVLGVLAGAYAAARVAAGDDVDEQEIAAAVLAGLGGGGRSDEEIAAALRAALGDRAGAVGQILAA